MVESQVIKYANKFSGSLKQNKGFYIILFNKTSYFTARINK